MDITGFVDPDDLHRDCYAKSEVAWLESRYQQQEDIIADLKDQLEEYDDTSERA